MRLTANRGELLVGLECHAWASGYMAAILSPEKGPSRGTTLGRRGGRGWAILVPQGAALLWLAVFTFSMSHGLKKTKECIAWQLVPWVPCSSGSLISEGGRMIGKCRGWSPSIVLGNPAAGSARAHCGLPVFLSTCQGACKPKGANTVGESLWLSQKQSLLMKLLTGIHIQEAVTEHLRAGFVLESPSVTLPRKHYLFEMEGLRPLSRWKWDSGC